MSEETCGKDGGLARIRNGSQARYRVIVGAICKLRKSCLDGWHTSATSPAALVYRPSADRRPFFFHLTHSKRRKRTDNQPPLLAGQEDTAQHRGHALGPVVVAERIPSGGSLWLRHEPSSIINRLYYRLTISDERRDVRVATSRRMSQSTPIQSCTMR